MIGAFIGVGTIIAATYSHSRSFLKAYRYLFPMTQFLSLTRDNLVHAKSRVKACETSLLAPDEIGELPAEELPLQVSFLATSCYISWVNSRSNYV